MDNLFWAVVIGFSVIALFLWIISVQIRYISEGLNHVKDVDIRLMDIEKAIRRHD